MPVVDLFLLVAPPDPIYGTVTVTKLINQIMLMASAVCAECMLFSLQHDP